MPYVDGFVLPILKQHVEQYQAIAIEAAEIWKEHGALEYWECVGDDLETDCSRTFADLASATEEETVIFAWAVYDSRAARDAANEKIIADPRMTEIMDKVNPLIDYKRMAHGGFKPIVHA